MPILINEVITEVEDTVTQRHEAEPVTEQLPLSVAEAELTHTLGLIQQRQERLKID